MQANVPRLSPAAEALKWQATAGVLEMACTQASANRGLCSGTRARILSEVVEALQTADSWSLLPLLQCLRQRIPYEAAHCSSVALHYILLLGAKKGIEPRGVIPLWWQASHCHACGTICTVVQSHHMEGLQSGNRGRGSLHAL